MSDSYCGAEGASNEGGVHLDPPPPVDAVMCVQIIRACGLLAAVNEASIWLGGGTNPSAPSPSLPMPCDTPIPFEPWQAENAGKAVSEQYCC